MHDSTVMWDRLVLIIFPMQVQIKQLANRGRTAPEHGPERKIEELWKCFVHLHSPRQRLSDLTVAIPAHETWLLGPENPKVRVRPKGPADKINNWVLATHQILP